MDHLNDDERQRLADLERELSDSDPRLARKMAAWPVPTAKPQSFWVAIIVSFVFLGIDAELFLLGLRWHNLILFLLTVAGFPFVAWPLTKGIRIRRRPPSGPMSSNTLQLRADLREQTESRHEGRAGQDDDANTNTA